MTTCYEQAGQSVVNVERGVSEKTWDERNNGREAKRREGQTEVKHERNEETECGDVDEACDSGLGNVVMIYGGVYLLMFLLKPETALHLTCSKY